MKLSVFAFSGILVLFFGMMACNDNGGNNPVDADNNNNNNNNGTTWTTDTIFSTGLYPAIVQDENANPRISFLDNNDGYVKYAVRNGDSWSIEPVAKVSDANGTFANAGVTSMALDAQDNPYITFYDYGSDQFKLASKNGNTWNIIPIPLPNDPKMSYDSPFIPGAESSVIIDKQNGIVHIALHMLGGLSGYVLGYWRSGMTAALIVDDSDGQTGFNNSIALDSNGWPAISYEAKGAGELKYAKWNGSGFDKETVADMPDIYWMNHLSSLRIDDADIPHIVFYGQGGYKYASKNGSVWVIKDLSFQSQYPSLSLSIDSNNNPEIVMVTNDFGNANRLKQACLNGSNWSYDNIEDNIQDCVIATCTTGRIAVAYVTDNFVLKYAYK